MEDEAQHGGRILPGWEEHDLVAGESNTTETSTEHNRNTKDFVSLLECCVVVIAAQV